MSNCTPTVHLLTLGGSRPTSARSQERAEVGFSYNGLQRTRGYDVTLTDNQKRALVKRIADIYEKVGVAGLALGLFQYNFQGALIGLGFLAVSLLLTYLLER